MPKFRFVCNKCNKEIIRLSPASWEYIPCSCGATMTKQLPKIMGTNVKEVVDKDRKIEWIDDQEKIMEKRSDDHYWKVIVPELVRSGSHSIKTMVENKWVYYNEKGELQIRTSPPEKDADEN